MRCPKKIMVLFLTATMLLPANTMAFAAGAETVSVSEAMEMTVPDGEADAFTESAKNPELEEAVAEEEAGEALSAEKAAVEESEASGQEAENEELSAEDTEAAPENAGISGNEGAESPDVSGSDWVDLDEIAGETKNTAKGFAIRHIDKDGNVLKEQYWTEDQMKELAQKHGKKPYYYSYGCSMQGFPSISKGEGVPLSDLLAEAGVEFKEGQKLMVRATDMLARETGLDTASEEWQAALADLKSVSSHNAYYTSFTWEELMGQTRYSFANGMAEAMAKNPSMTQADLYNDEAVIQSGTEVGPLLCYGYNVMYVNQVQTADDVKNLTMNRRDAYRFCFGQAMDENGKISSEDTRSRIAKYVFGLDVVDAEDVTLEPDGPCSAKGAIRIKGQAPKISQSIGAYFENINKVILDGQELAKDQYAVKDERGTNGWVYYLELDESVITRPGTYTLQVESTTYNPAQVQLEVEEAAAPRIVDFAVTNKEHDDNDGELNQTIIATVTFDHRIAISKNPEDLAKDLDICIAGGNVKETKRDITYAVNPEDQRQLVITMASTDWAAVYNGILSIQASAGGVQSITSEDKERDSPVDRSGDVYPHRHCAEQ